MLRSRLTESEERKKKHHIDTYNYSSRFGGSNFREVEWCNDSESASTKSSPDSSKENKAKDT